MTYIQPHMRTSLEGHQLKCLCYTESVKVFLLHRPNTGIMRVQLSFTPEGIHLTGDVCLGRDLSGIGTQHFKPLGWFANPDLGKSYGYLCEKFLYKQFQQEKAVEDARFNAEHYASMAADETWDDEERQTYRTLAGSWLQFAVELQRCNDDVDAQHCAYGYYGELDDPDAFEGLGMDYPREDAGWLCAIQEKFAELFAKWTPPCCDAEDLEFSGQSGDPTRSGD